MDVFGVDVVDLHVDSLFRGVVVEVGGELRAGWRLKEASTFDGGPNEVEPNPGIGVKRHR
jgi:hypothetical protein